MPALRFKTCHLLSGNVRNKELTIVQRRILRKLRMKKRSIKKKIYPRKIVTVISNYKLHESCPFFMGIYPSQRCTEEQNELHISLFYSIQNKIGRYSARQPISHRKVCVNNGIVNISHFKVSHGDIISFQENYARTRGEEIRRFFYIKISVEKIIGKFWGRRVRMQRRNKRRSKTKWLRRVRMWRRSKTGWFRRLKTKKRCRLLLKDKDRFLQKLHSSMQEEDLERTKKFGSDAEHNRMKRNLYHSVTLFLSKKRRKRRINRKKPNSGFDGDAIPQPRGGSTAEPSGFL
ncbi:Ribosomal protein S4 mitochondrial [Bienertia sinuspersici]